MKTDDAPGASEMPSALTAGVPSPPFNRRVLLENFDDGGLTTGSRDIEVYLPIGYDTSADHYPVIYLNDGRAVLSDDEMDTLYAEAAYDRLIDDGLINPAIFVGIFNVHEGRLTDLTPTLLTEGQYSGNGGGLDGFYRFISERLKPYIDSRYRTKPEAVSTGIAGFSVGGLAAFLMAYDHPETFGLAGCMSPSLWWGGEYALKHIMEGGEGKKPVRFWLDAGGGEYTMWLHAARAYGVLEQRGWRAGDDLAAYFDYPANHDWTPVRSRAREMLHFLLRKDPLELIEYRLVHAANPTAPVMDFNPGHRRIVGAEAVYANGLRLTVPQPGITIDDANVVSLDTGNPNLLHGIGPGETVISSTYQGHTASLNVIGYHADISRGYLECLPANTAPNIDDGPVDWPNLPHSILDESRNTIARFGVSYDARHIHIAVHVQDSTIVAELGTMPGEQDSIGVIFDARPELIICRGEGYNFGDDPHLLVVCMSPGNPGGEISIASRGTRISPGSEEWARIMPDGAQATCVINAQRGCANPTGESAPAGYRGVLSLPISYLDAKQDGPWRVFRLNIWINNLDTAGGPVTETWWQPKWNNFQSFITSGIFAREEHAS